MAQPTAHVPPQNIDAEESVLGAMLVFEPSITKVIDEVKLKPTDFYLDRHRVIFSEIYDLYEASKPVDELTVTEALTQHNEIGNAGGKEYVSELAAKVPAAGNAKHYATIVQENALLRRLLEAGQEIQGWVNERDGEPRELSERAERKLFEVAHSEQASDFREIKEILSDEIDRLEKLATGESELTGTPSGFRDLDAVTGGFQPGNLIIVAARPSMGKCLAGSTLVYDPTTGARRRLDEVVAAVERGEDAWVASLGADLKLKVSKVAAAASNGCKPTFKVRSKLGREIEGTANHRVLTMSGWRQINELREGDRIGIPRSLPWTGRRPWMDPNELLLLAALIADGCVTQSTPRFCYGQNSAVLPLVEEAAANLGCGVRHDGRGNARLSNGRGAKTNPVTELCRKHGIWGTRADTKFVPDEIFRLGDWQISQFLSILWACDGHIHATENLSQIGYTTISERLARDVQHLLLRLGIVSKIRTLKRPVYEGTGKVAREVLITGQKDVFTFAMRMFVPGKEAQTARVVDRSDLVRVGTNVDTLPKEVWTDVLAAKGARSWASISSDLGRPRNHNWHVGTRGLSRGLLAQLATGLDSQRLRDLSTSDVWWDEVIAVEEAGEQETFDLQVPGDECFVADDMIVHNSALVVNMAENMSMKHGLPVAFFSLEMSEVELAQRFIACRSRIPGDRLRKGKVSQRDWPKVVRACGELENAPLWIDDSSDLGLLDLRAKARRLHAQEQARGGLGAVVVDYLQLMRAEDIRSANRVEQVGRMSRGLKILARELDVPVIALSQLSRAPEQRPDKRPILSDLRESGCLVGDSRVYLPDSGGSVAVGDLEGETGFRVLAYNPDTQGLEPATVTNSFCTGIKPTFRLSLVGGRTIAATANHKFLTPGGWKRLDQLRAGDRLAVPKSSGSSNERIWEEVASIQGAGEEAVYDLTVEGLHNFVADDIVVHNSIEQDADVVAFLYRDEYYNQDSEDEGLAEVIISKHRNGPIGTTKLAFISQYPKFIDRAQQDRPVEQAPGEGPPMADVAEF